MMKEAIKIALIYIIPSLFFLFVIGYYVAKYFNHPTIALIFKILAIISASFLGILIIYYLIKKPPKIEKQSYSSIQIKGY